MNCPVVAPAGTVTFAWVSLRTVRTALCVVPTHADVEPVKPEPVTVMIVPVGPELGEKLVIFCCGGTVVTVNAEAETAV